MTLAIIPSRFLVTAPSGSLKIAGLRACCLECPKSLLSSRKSLTSSSFRLETVTNIRLCLGGLRWFTRFFVHRCSGPWFRCRYLQQKVFVHLMPMRMLSEGTLSYRSTLHFSISDPTLWRCYRRIHLQRFTSSLMECWLHGRWHCVPCTFSVTFRIRCPMQKGFCRRWQQREDHRWWKQVQWQRWCGI